MNNNEKKIICFVRHGKTLENLNNRIQGRKDFPLSDVGRSEALLTANYLKEFDSDWDVVYCSPLSRAKETAEIIASVIGYKKDIIIEDGFIEREFGVSEGMPADSITFIKVLDDSWEGLEKTIDLQNRVKGTLLNILNNTEYKKILVVTHSHTIKGLLSSIDNSIKMNYPIKNCSMNYFVYENGDLTIQEISKLPQ